MITVISGSSRINSQSSKIAHYVVEQLKAEFEQETALLDLGHSKLPDFDDSLFVKKEEWNAQWTQISKQLLSSNAFVIISPEWDGMAPACLKNLFHLSRNGEFFHKPALLISISAGINGAYPIMELRSSSYKNSRICYLPDHMIIRKVGETFNQAQAVDEHDHYYRDYLTYLLKMLLTYKEAFTLIHEAKIFNREKYPNGN